MKALKSCTNVVPSFQNKIIWVYLVKEKNYLLTVASYKVKNAINFVTNCSASGIENSFM